MGLDCLSRHLVWERSQNDLTKDIFVRNVDFQYTLLLRGKKVCCVSQCARNLSCKICSPETSVKETPFPLFSSLHKRFGLAEARRMIDMLSLTSDRLLSHWQLVCWHSYCGILLHGKGMLKYCNVDIKQNVCYQSFVTSVQKTPFKCYFIKDVIN